jgi:hypothetical protein
MLEYGFMEWVVDTRKSHDASYMRRKLHETQVT